MKGIDQYNIIILHSTISGMQIRKLYRITKQISDGVTYVVNVSSKNTIK